MNTNADTFFLKSTCIFLGAVTAALIAMPMFSALSYGSATILVFTILGGVIGNKRASRPFLYFLLFSVLVLSSLLIKSFR